MMNSMLRLCLLWGALLPTAAVFGQTTATAVTRPADWPASRPSIVYVADFELGAAPLEPEQQHRMRDGRLGRRLRGESEDPAATEAQLVETLVTGIVDHLAKAGVTAQRLDPTGPRPRAGWLVRGVFVEADEGNRLRRAALGFGSGKTELQLIIAVSDLAAGADAPIYTFGTAAESGRRPGAVLTLNPYVAGAKFLLNRNSLQKDAKATAAQIAGRIAAAATDARPAGAE